jgi:hypothetical protein
MWLTILIPHNQDARRDAGKFFLGYTPGCDHSAKKFLLERIKFGPLILSGSTDTDALE